MKNVSLFFPPKYGEQKGQCEDGEEVVEISAHWSCPELK